MININAWKAAGSDYSVSPGLPSLELADVFRSIFHFPEGLIAIGVVVVGIVLICIFGLRIGWGQNGVTDSDRNLTVSSSGSYGTASFMSPKEASACFDVTSAKKTEQDILAELKPTIEFDDGISSGTLSLDHSTIKTEAAGYKSSSYTVTATKNYTGLDRNDSSYIDKTVEKNGRTLSLSNVTWSVERTALVGDELVPATYSAVATYSGTASSTVATGYITTAEYKGTVVSSGISSILYTVTYLGTEIVPVEEEPTFNGSIVVIPVIGGTILLATLLLLGLLLRKNTTVYKATGKGNEYEKCGRLRLKTKDPELRIDRLKDIPEGMIAVEVDQAVAKKLFGQTIAIHCYDNTVEHTVGTVNGQYWFKVDIGTQEGEPDTEEEPV